MECDGTQTETRVTGRDHVGDICLKSARGKKHPQLAGIIHETRASAGSYCLARDPGYVGRSMVAVPPDADGAAFACTTIAADGNVVAAEGEGLAGKVADGDVVAAGIRSECVGPEGGIIVPADVDIERQVTAGGVVTACLVGEERLVSTAGIAAADSVAENRERAICRVGGASGAAKKRSGASGRVVVC